MATKANDDALIQALEPFTKHMLNEAPALIRAVVTFSRALEGVTGDHTNDDRRLLGFSRVCRRLRLQLIKTEHNVITWCTTPEGAAAKAQPVDPVEAGRRRRRYNDLDAVPGPIPPLDYGWTDTPMADATDIPLNGPEVHTDHTSSQAAEGVNAESRKTTAATDGSVAPSAAGTKRKAGDVGVAPPPKAPRLDQGCSAENSVEVKDETAFTVLQAKDDDEDFDMVL